jgi:excisionase family DNA binding protein
VNTHDFLFGEPLAYPDPPPAVAAFLDRAKAAAADPTVSVNDFIALVYGLENPLLDQTILPGRAMVTRTAFEDPVYLILMDLLDRKRVQLGQLDLEAVRAAHSLTAAQAAEQLGISAAAVRAAIASRRLAAVLLDGQYRLRPEAVAAYKVSNRGPKAQERVRRTALEAAADAAEAVAGPSTDVRVRAGAADGASLSVRVSNGAMIKAGPNEYRFRRGWAWALVRTTSEKGVRAFEIEPAPHSQHEVELEHAGLYIKGAFRIVRKFNSTKAAQAAWDEANEKLKV